MSKEQIEEKHELSESIYMSGHGLDWKDSNDIAEQLHNEGYRKQSEAEWVKVRNHKECSKCHYRAPYKKIKAGYHLQDLTHYCPNCGSKMKGV